MIALIYAVNKLGYIGKNNKLMYNIPADMRRFRDLTKGHTVLMGRKTWESLPEMFRPLPDRHNVVLTSNTEYKAVDATVIHSLEDYLSRWANDNRNTLFIIGGADLINKCQGHAHSAHVTYVDDETVGDASVNPLVREVWLPTYKETFPASNLSPPYMFTSFLSMVRRIVTDF